MKMKEIERNVDRKGWVAAVAGITLPGMGQIYNGELFKGFCFFAVFAMIPFAGFKLTVTLPDGYLIAGLLSTVTASLALHVFSIVDAYRRAKKQGKGYFLKKYNRWYFYVAAWLFCSIFILGYSSEHTKKNVVGLYKIVTQSMQPHVLPGDLVIVDKTAYEKFPPRAGDIVIHIYPDDRSKVYIRRIEGLPGDTITLEDGRTITVPHGSVYVLGDNRKKSRDSKTFGPVPLKDVVGKARQVFFSRGDDGIRWGRIGRSLTGPDGGQP
jgi:signal peptidase I